MKTKALTKESHNTANHEVMKTLSMQVAITEPDLPNTVRQAFDLAKGGGRELNLAFAAAPDEQTIPASAPTGQSQKSTSLVQPPPASVGRNHVPAKTGPKTTFGI